MPINKLKVQERKTVIPDMPFYGRTTYGDNFKDFHASEDSLRININFPKIPNPL